MPAKNIESLNIKDKTILRWLRSLSESTGAVYGTRFRLFLNWCQENGIWETGKEMIEDAKNHINDIDTLYENHLDPIIEYISQKNTSANDRRATFNCIKSFYEHYRITLPKPTVSERKTMFKINDKDKERARLKPLELREVKQIILNLKQPYKAAYTLMFQSAMGSAEFDQFNTGEEWKELLKVKKEKDGTEYREIDADEPQINLIREKTSTERVQKYYTFISKDAKDMIKEWLDIRPKEADDINCLFCVWYNNTQSYKPLTAHLLGIHVRKTAKKLGIIKPNRLNYYHTHLHELRDLFKSLCSLNGVNKIASEFFLGHDIDKLGYDKSPKYDTMFFRDEYSKVAPVLNLFSENGEVKKKIDQVANDFREELKKKDEENKKLREQLENLQDKVAFLLEEYQRDKETTTKKMDKHIREE